MRSLTNLVSLGVLVFVLSSFCSCNIQPAQKYFYPPTPQPFANNISKLDKRRARLVKYISKRTVRVVCVKSLIDKKTNKILIYHEKCGWGTGSIIRSYSHGSYILTAYHVVNGNDTDEIYIDPKTYSVHEAKWVYYYLIERRNLKNKVTNVFGGATVVMHDSARDIAVLNIPHDLKIQSSISHNVVIGQEAHVLGYPGISSISGIFLSYTHGFVGTMHLNNKNKKQYRQHDRFDMDVYMGNSGSAIWDNNGRIVGMVNWVTGMRFMSGYFLPQPKQTFGCSARGILISFNNSNLSELKHF